MLNILKRLSLVTVTVFSLALVLSGCSDGTNGLNGVEGPAGPAGAAGADATLFKASNKNISFDAITMSNAGGYPSVDFTISDGTTPVTGLTASLMRFYIAELVPGAAATDSDQWQRWVQERTGTGNTIGTFTELGAGKYKYTFATPFTSAPSQVNTQRFVMRIRGLAGFNSVNANYDFKIADPATKLANAKDIVTSAACNQCHGANINNYGHGGGYTETTTCVICHSPLLADTDMAAGGYDFVTMVHQIHSKINGKTAATDSAAATDWSAKTFNYPSNMMNCDKCHKGTQGQNWNTRPTRAACKSCHITIKFDGSAFTGIKGAAGQLHTATSDSTCAGCHDVSGALGVKTKHVLPASQDASLRPLNPTITAVSVDSTTGKVTVNFTVTNNGTAVTDPAAFALPSFVFAKLMPAAKGKASYWQSLLNQFRTKDGTKKPVLQGTNEAATAGTVTYDAAKSAFAYTFVLPYAATPGDIRDGFTKAPIKRSNAPYVNDTMLSLPSSIAYDPTATYRVGMQFTNNKNNAYFDFVPDGTTAKKTRKVVDMAKCQVCHDGSALHGRYDVNYCVACHSQNSYDPFTGDPNGGDVNSGTGGSNLAPVNLQTIIHKIHMGNALPSVKEGTPYLLNGGEVSVVVGGSSYFPQAITNCLACHDDSLSEGKNWKDVPTTNGCNGCHDSGALGHINGNNAGGYDSCTTCHATGKQAPAKDAHYGL